VVPTPFGKVKFHGCYHGDVIVSGRLLWRNNWSQQWKSVVLVLVLVLFSGRS
jgi:hypothetical protein